MKPLAGSEIPQPPHVHSVHPCAYLDFVCSTYVWHRTTDSRLKAIPEGSPLQNGFRLQNRPANALPAQGTATTCTASATTLPSAPSVFRITAFGTPCLNS